MQAEILNNIKVGLEELENVDYFDSDFNREIKNFNEIAKEVCEILNIAKEEIDLLISQEFEKGKGIILTSVTAKGKVKTAILNNLYFNGKRQQEIADYHFEKIQEKIISILQKNAV